MAVTYVMLARLPPERLDAFDAYENAVLPLLTEYGGHVEPADAHCHLACISLSAVTQVW